MYSFDEILRRMLAMVPNNFDKRQGSIIYDALAPCAAELAQAYINLDIWKMQTYVATATGQNLDNRGADFAFTRKPATIAQRIGITIDTNGNPINLPIGSRFSVPNVEKIATYYISEYLNPGECVLVCEQAGTIGNAYTGAILPLFAINNLAEATIISTRIPAQDVETDDDFRRRIMARLNEEAFGGNVADYREFVTEIDGVSSVKVFPIWNGGGTVLISVLDSEYNPATPEFIEVIKEIVDPEEYKGQGIGTAPIGHTVTVTTPQKRFINVDAKLIVSGISIGQAKTDIEKNINEHFLALRKNWQNGKQTAIYISRIIETILKTMGVINVSAITLDNSTEDIIITDTAALQQIPFLGAVTLRE